jgi:PBP1b-binding outer membrane lipoprotein LpoB
MRNVLNTYTRHLRNNNKKAANLKQDSGETPVDRISISDAGRHEVLLEKITSDIVNKIFEFNSVAAMEYNIISEPRNRLNGNLSPRDADNNKLAFHAIDSNNVKHIETLEMNSSDFLVKSG